MRSLTPLLHVQDLIESLAFYQTLGFELEQKVPEEGEPTWAYLVVGPIHLMLQQTEERMADQRLERELEQDLVLHIGHPDIEDFHALLVAHELPVSELQEGGLLEFMVRDPDGYTLVFFHDEG